LKAKTGGNKMFHWNGTKWDLIKGRGGATITVGPKFGNVWMTDNQNRIFFFSKKANKWAQIPGKAQDLAIGGPRERDIYRMGVTKTYGKAGEGFTVYKYNPKVTKKWVIYARGV